MSALENNHLNPAPAYIRMKQALILSSLSRAQVNRMIADGRLPKPGKLSSGVAVWPYEEFVSALHALYTPAEVS